MKIRRFACDPVQEIGNYRGFPERIDIIPDPGKLCIAEDLVNGPVADGMDRDGFATLPGLWHGMMLLNAATQRTPTQPANLLRHCERSAAIQCGTALALDCRSDCVASQ